MRPESGVELDLSAGSPAMLRGLPIRRWEDSNHRRLLEALRRRRDGLLAGGTWRLGWLQDLDLEVVRVLLCDRKVTLHAKRVLMAVICGTLPTGNWLQSYGYEAAAMCVACGAADDV